MFRAGRYRNKRTIGDPHEGIACPTDLLGTQTGRLSSNRTQRPLIPTAVCVQKSACILVH